MLDAHIGTNPVMSFYCDESRKPRGGRGFGAYLSRIGSLPERVISPARLLLTRSHTGHKFGHQFPRSFFLSLSSQGKNKSLASLGLT